LSPNKAIHDFAIYWLEKYQNPNTTGQEVEKDFGDQCRSLGFEMDGGRAMNEAYPNVYPLSDPDALQSIINEITDISMLGSAIYSNWRFATHWAETSLLEPEYRTWFICALSRLADLSADRHR